MKNKTLLLADKGMIPYLRPQIIFKKISLAPCFFAQGGYYIIATKFSLSTCKYRLRGDGQSAAPDRGQGRPPDWTSRPPALAPSKSRPLTRRFPRAGWALIAGSGDRCLLCRRDSEEGHGTFRTSVRRLPDRKIEKGSVTSRSRGNPRVIPLLARRPLWVPGFFSFIPRSCLPLFMIPPEPTAHP